MPPRLPLLSGPARLLLRPFSTTPAVALPPREAHSPALSAATRLSNLNSPPSRAAAAAAPAGGAAERPAPVVQMLERHRMRAQKRMREQAGHRDMLRANKMSEDYLKQMPRKWQSGDVYSPRDLSPWEMEKWRRRSPRQEDIVDALGIRPLDMYKNFSLIEHFTHSSAMIKNSSLTRLRPVNQRKIAKMVRRVQGMGIYPTVHAHPEMIREQFYGRSR